MKIRMKRLILAILLILVMAVSVNADMLKWDASTGDVTGYRIYYGTETGIYPHNEDIGNVTEFGTEGVDGTLAELLDLNPGTWYIIVRAYNGTGESGDSNIADLTMIGDVPPDGSHPIKIEVPGPATLLIYQN